VGGWWGYKSMFIFGTVCALLSLILLVRIPTPRKKT
jgi:hypothetical protein